MGKRRRARQITKPEDDEGPNIAKEIEEIKDPLQTLYKAANIKVKKETKSKIKENEEEKEISLPKYKEIHFRDDEIDTFTMHFEKDRLNNHLSSENKGFKVIIFVLYLKLILFRHQSIQHSPIHWFLFLSQKH